MDLGKFVMLLYLLHRCLAGTFEYTRPYFSPDAVRNYTLRIERNLCVDQPYKYFELLTCSNRLMRNQPSVTYFAGRFRSPQNPVFVRYKVYYRFQTYQPFLLDEYFNYCDVYAATSNGSVSNVNRLTVGSLRSSIPNLPGCPLQGLLNVTYVINEAQFPPFLPAGHYRLDMTFLTADNQTLFAVQTFLSVRAKGASDLAMG